METPKTGPAQQSSNATNPAKIDPRKPAPARQSKPIEILELSLEEEIDVGNDPYNNTGEQIILKIREDAKR
jgi:hypothetical protein